MSSLGDRELPDWYASAKLGIFIHWGLYSVPAFADDPHGTFHGYMADLMAMRNTTGKNPYAEWYLNALRLEDSPTARHHAATYGAQTPYVAFREQFEMSAAAVDFTEWASLFASMRAEYVVMVTRHLDGYSLWPTSVPHPSLGAYHSPRDLVGDLSNAVRDRGMRMGLYYAGGVDWMLTSKPVRVLTDLMEQQAGSPEYAQYAAAQWRELIDRYRPSVLWNDMGWPAQSDPNEIFEAYYAAVPDGVVNDRWSQVRLPRGHVARSLYLGFLGWVLRLLARSGRPVPVQTPTVPFDVRTFEYEVPAAPQSRPWEVTRGLGNSFGYSAAETSADLLTGRELIHLFVDVVARGGRLLLNVGPDGKGRIPEVQRAPLAEFADWVQAAGEALFGTTPWTVPSAETTLGDQVRFTRSSGTLNVILLADRPGPIITIPEIAIPSTATARMLGSDQAVTWRRAADGVEISLPALEPSAAHVIVFDGGATG